MLIATKLFTGSTIIYYFSLKLGNLMLNEEMQVKIGDFGLAARL